MSKIQLADLKAFEAHLGEKLPGFQVRFKDESRFMALLGALTFLFNPRFMTAFTTTIGRTVYFTTKVDYERSPELSFRTLAHEYVHIVDDEEHGLWFGISYLFPQVLTTIPLALFGALVWPHTWLLLLPFVGYGLATLLASKGPIGAWVALGTTLVGTLVAAFTVIVWWQVLIFITALALLAPWPAPWRTAWEIRGYSMSLAVMIWRRGIVPAMYRESIILQFTGPNYYFMSWRRPPIETALDRALQGASDGSLLDDQPFNVVYKFLLRKNLLHIPHAQ